MEAVPAPAGAPQGGMKMTRVDILCKMERFDALKRAMFNIGITGMTAINVMGCGEQRGKTKGYFRGAKAEAAMLPSIQVSIVVSKVPVSLVVGTARQVLCTGFYGDGKIFVYSVENVVKVRTGEQGHDGLSLVSGMAMMMRYPRAAAAEARPISFYSWKLWRDFVTV